MNLIKTSYYTFISTAIKMLAALVINKAVAYLVGPSGIALIGQFQNFSQLTMTAAQGGINTGVVKYVAEFKDNKSKLLDVFSSSLKITLICTSITTIILLLFSQSFSNYFLKSAEYSDVIIVFAISLIFFSVNGLLISIINGLQEIKIFTKVNIGQSIYSLIFTFILVFIWGVKGALFALATNQSVVFFTLIFLLKKHALVRLENFKSFFSKSIGQKLFSYSLMTLISSIITPVSLIIIRNHLITRFSIDVAGEWQALWYISTMYLMVITTTLSVYYLPKLSSISDNYLLKKEILIGYKLIIPFLFITALIIFFSRDLIIKILFTEKFYRIRDLFLFQLIGDFLKLSSWLLSYIMLAKAMTKAFIITEVIFTFSFILFSFLFVDHFGFIGVTYAFALNYLLYFVCMIFLFKDLIKSKEAI
jgi:PST family polysaccharide transporter